MALTTHSAKIAHLLRRTGFTATKQQIAALEPYTIPEIVDQLLNASQPHPASLVYTDTVDLDNRKRRDYPIWWIQAMAKSTNPLLEKMTLFWHGHFTSAIHKVKVPDLMLRQNKLLRTHALGNFKQLAYEISIDPAMMIWLDNNSNHRLHPNENYSREFLELFALGLGNFTEMDMLELARALTGWRLNKDTLDPEFIAVNWDAGQKTILGKTAAFGLKDAVEHVVTQVSSSVFVATKVFEYFAFMSPDVYVTNNIAYAFSKSGYQIKELLRAIFVHDAFYANKADHTMIKGPTEYVVGILSLFPNWKIPDDRAFLSSMRLMGQLVFDPPHVAGWPHNQGWLNSSMLFARYNFAEGVCQTLTTADLPSLALTDHAAFLLECLDLLCIPDLSLQTRRQVDSYVSKAMLDTTLTPEAINRGVLHLLLISPDFQIK